MTLKDSYMDLITSQHRGKAKYTATVDVLLQASEDVFQLAVYMDDEFDLEYAVGKQQDVLGHIVGQSRIVEFQPDRGLSPILDNYAYRNLLKATIAKNMWKGGISELRDIWLNLFGRPIIIQDNQDMTINVVTIGISDQITKNLIEEGYIVPKPQGVGINYAFADEAVFGYDMETSTIKGYDHAEWMNHMPADSFAYDNDNDDEKQRLFGYDGGNFT